MYFLLAIALWVCIAYILISGKYRREKSQKERNEWFCEASEDHDRFVALYSASDELLSAVKHLTYSDDNEAMIMRHRIERETGVESTSDMVILALLAQHCKMPKVTAYSGFRSSPCGKKEMEIERRFLTWYDKELRFHGLPYKLLFTPWHERTEFRAGDITVSLPVSARPEVTSGVYFWEPIRAFAFGGENIVIQENNLVK